MGLGQGTSFTTKPHGFQKPEEGRKIYLIRFGITGSKIYHELTLTHEPSEAHCKPLLVNWAGTNLGRFYAGHLGRWSDQRKRGTMGWGACGWRVGGRVSVAPVVVCLANVPRASYSNG